FTTETQRAQRRQKKEVAMRYLRPTAICAGVFLLSSLCSLCLCGENPGRDEPHRSPCDLAVLPDGHRVLTANPAADSVSLVDVRDGKVRAELRCGRKPSAVAVARDGKRAAVSNLWSGTVTLLEIGDASLKAAGEVSVGPLPRGLA